MVAKTKASTGASFGAVIDRLWAVREEKRTLEAQVKECDAKIAELQDQLMERMETEGLDKASGSKASVSITEALVADVQDWDALWVDVAKRKLFHLIQRRVSDAAYRELVESGKKLAGTVPFTKKKLNLRSL